MKSTEKPIRPGAVLIITATDAYCDHCGFDFYDYIDEDMEEFYNYCPCCGAQFVEKRKQF